MLDYKDILKQEREKRVFSNPSAGIPIPVKREGPKDAADRWYEKQQRKLARPQVREVMANKRNLLGCPLCKGGLTSVRNDISKNVEFQCRCGYKRSRL